MGLNSKIDFERTNLELFMERKKLTQRSFHISIRLANDIQKQNVVKSNFS